MTPEDICKSLEGRFGDAVTDTVLGGGHPYAVVKADRWLEVARFLRDEPSLGFNLLNSITGLDLLEEDKLACVYDMSRVPIDCGDQLITETHLFAVRVVTERSAPSIPSVAGLWAAADWHEREIYDLFGVDFPGHPDLRRILCPDDWVGHPLRKDYAYPLEYHGIPGTTEYELPNPRH